LSHVAASFANEAITCDNFRIFEPHSPSAAVDPRRAAAPREANRHRPKIDRVTGDELRDELDRLWTPHRMAYVSGDAKPEGGYDKRTTCPFCLTGGPDDNALIVTRGELVFAVLNKYPYNPGHLMVVPYRHIPLYTDLTVEETGEFSAFTQTAMRAITSVSGAHGFNIGMNQGAVAGAGIASHLHQHVVPRWGGDTNFMPVIGRTKVLPQLLEDTRDLLAKAWATA
jgi:ATP adenylyltransferase